MVKNKTSEATAGDRIEFVKVTDNQSYPKWTNRNEVVQFFHDTMKPYEDKIKHIKEALEYAFSTDPGKGGFLTLVEMDKKLVGALLMQRTGMGGYIPENILLFVTVSPELRGKGVGSKLIEHCIDECEGDVKLHVEYDNPAKGLYERIGFKNKYADMRFTK